jgi:hypothetical protein
MKMAPLTLKNNLGVIFFTKLDIYAFYATIDAVLPRGALAFLAATILKAFTIIMYVKHGL